MHPITKRLMNPTILRFERVVKTTEHTRSHFDGRVFVECTVVAYRDQEGNEYRKAYETKPGVDPAIPSRGTHQALNSVAKQWE